MSNYIYFPILSELLGIPDHPVIDDGIPEDAVYFSTQGSGEFNSFYGMHHTSEARKKISNATKGEKNPFYGKSHSKETCKILSEKNTGYLHTDEARKKMSEKAKGKKKSEAHRKSMSIAQQRKHGSK